MAKYRYSTARRTVNYRGIAVVAVVVAGIGFVGMIGRDYSIQRNIKKLETSIETIEKDKITIEEEIKALETKNATLRQEAEAMEEILWRYEPVIIPESMQ